MLKSIIFLFTSAVFDTFRLVRHREGLGKLYNIALYRNAVYLMMNSAVTAALGFVFWLIATRFYSAEEVGLASAIISAASLIALISTLGLDFGLIRFLPGSGEKASPLINACLTIGGLVAMLTAFFFLLGVNIWAPAIAFILQDNIYFISFVLFTLTVTLSTLLGQVFVAERHAGFTLAQSTIFSSAKILLVILLAIVAHAIGIFASWGIALAIAIAVSIFLFLPRVQTDYSPIPVIRRKVVNEILHYSFVNYISNLVWAAPAYILPIMVVNTLGAEQNAYFYIAWAAGSLLATIPMATSLSLFAEGAHDEKQLGYDLLRSLKLILILVIPAIVAILAVGDKLLLLFGSDYSRNGTRLLWLLAIAAVPMSVNYSYFSVRRVEKKLKGVLALTIFVAVITLGLSYLLLPRLGILGCGVAWLASQVVAALASSYYLWSGKKQKIA